MTRPKIDKTVLSKAGFAPARRSPRRLIANIQSADKSCGKTRLALTSPGPIGYIAVEAGGGEGVIDHFIEKGLEETDRIQVANISMDAVEYPDRAEFTDTKEGEALFNEAVTKAVQGAAVTAMDKFYDAYYASLGNMRTTIVDTGTDLYELMRLAEFGRLEKIPQLAYGQLNQQVASLFDDAYNSKGNVIWIHHMKEVWENKYNEKGKLVSTPTGTYKMDGSKVVKDKVQAVIELWRESLPDEEPNADTGRLVKFHCQIVDSRHSADAIGEHLQDNNITFGLLARMLIPTSAEDDWK